MNKHALQLLLDNARYATREAYRAFCLSEDLATWHWTRRHYLELAGILSYVEDLASTR